MTNNNHRSKDGADPSVGSGQGVRQKAEVLVRERAARMPEDSAALSPEEIRKTLHELRVHQIELEMQNEELRTTQAMIEAGRERYIGLYDLAPVGYCTLSEQGLILEANLTAATLLGTTRGMLIKQPISRFILKDNLDIFYLYRKQLFETGEPQECELQLVKPDGACFWAHLAATASQTEDYTPVCRVVLSDISKRKQAETALADAESLLRVAGSLAHLGAWSVDLRQGRVYWTEEVAAIHEMPAGYSPTVEEAISFYAPEYRPRISQVFDRCVRQGISYDEEMQIITGKGNRVWVKTVGVAVRDKKGGTVAVHGGFQDITPLKQAQEEALRAAQEWQTTFDATQDAIWILDREQRIVRSNRASDQLLGQHHAELLGRHCWEVMHGLSHPHEDCPINKMKQSLRRETMEMLLGEQWYLVAIDPIIDDTGRYAGAVHIVSNITSRKRAEAEREKLQAQLVQAQKMEAVGQLAGGVAHDYNNMLSVILGNTELALSRVPSGDALYEDLMEVHDAALRSANITRQLLAFARKQTISPVELDLNEAVEGILKMLRRLIGEGVDLAWQPGSSLWPVMFDPSQLDQILANLCVNARDSIGNIGTITIETAKQSISESDCMENPGASPGEFVMLTVRDTGGGMDEAVLEHIFEPFFTTKGIGSGTGLGLATVYGIVKQNKGFIRVESEPGQGACFKIYLPRHIGEGVAEQKGQIEEVFPGAGETIVVVEDERAILRITGKMLVELGYTVLAAETPEQALSLAADHKGKIDLLLTDVVMPVMNGRDLAEQMKTCQPELKVVFMSGYTADVIAKQGVLDMSLAFLHKPFSKSVLSRMLRQVLS